MLPSENFVRQWFPWCKFALHKICENTGFQWPVFSRIRTKSAMFSLYGRIRATENPYSSIFYAVLSSAYLNLFFCLLILLFYPLIISYCTVNSTFLGCNYFLFDRIRRKRSMFRNTNFYRFRPAIEVLLIYHCPNFISKLFLIFFDRT